jgi:hypothetical protein
MTIADTCWRGRDYRLADRLASGDPATVTGMPVGVMRRARGNTTDPDMTTPEILFSASFVAASGGERARWQFNLTAVQTAALAPGRYIFASRYTLNGGTIMPGPVTLVQVRDAP